MSFIDVENSHKKDSSSDQTGADGGHVVHANAELVTETDGYSIDAGMSHYLDAGHLFGHVQDAYYIEVPHFLTGASELDEHGHVKKHAGKIEIPNLTGATVEKPLIPALGIVGRPTKFMALELLAALLIAAAYIWLARKITSNGNAPKGKLWNFLESIVCFIRDDIVRPTIGKADADRYLPFLLTLFFFILVLNLFGMIPFLGSATGALAVTAVFAIVTFAVVLGVGMKKMGVVGFLKAQVPHMDLSPVLAIVLVPSLWMIEIFGLFVKHFVLAIRLFANMFAGHLVLAVFLGFIGAASGGAVAMFWGITPAVILVAIALSVLELFVACLQAYVFTFLASLFIGAAMHPH